MAGLLWGEHVSGPQINRPCSEPFRRRGVGFARGHAVGKFFLFIVAVSVAILLATSVYIISL